MNLLVLSIARKFTSDTWNFLHFDILTKSSTEMLNIQPDIQSVSFFDTKSVDISITRRRVVFIEDSSESLNDSLEFYLAVWTLVGILASIFLKIRRKRKTWKKNNNI